MELTELVQKPKMKAVSRYWLWLLWKYFRIDVQGLENIPKTGRALIVPNHSGFLAADAVLLTFAIKRRTRRRARILAHRAFFDFFRKLREVSESHGLRKASVQDGVAALNRDHLVILFPEGEAGNFKPSFRRYRLQRFHTGFLRMAIQAKAPIIPCVIVGAEESNLNLGNINLSSWVKNLRIPLPLNLFPLPAKWSITFLPPVDPSAFAYEGILEDRERLNKEARRFQRVMQKEIHCQVKAREYVYFEDAKKWMDQAAHVLESALEKVIPPVPPKLPASKRQSTARKKSKVKQRRKKALPAPAEASRGIPTGIRRGETLKKTRGLADPAKPLVLVSSQS